MSVVSTIYETFRANVATQLISHSRIPNPYKIEENLEPSLKQGWAIQIGPAENTNRIVCGTTTVRRRFTLIITRKMYAQELDSTAKESVEKQLLEDLRLVLNTVEANPKLSTSSGDFKYEGDEGIDFVFADKDNFIKLTALFSVEYWEVL